MECFRKFKVVESGTSRCSLLYIVKDKRGSSNAIDAYFLVRELTLETEEMTVSELEDRS